MADPAKCDPTSIDNYNVINDRIYYSDSTSFLQETRECLMWCSDGDIEVKSDIKNMKLPDSGVIWKLMISFPSDFAINNGLVSKYDYYELTKNILPDLFADAGLKIDNIVWYAGLHRNTKNPHMHICFFQKENIYMKKTMPESAIYKLRSNIANYLTDNTDFYKEKDLFLKNIVGTISIEEFTQIKSPKFFDSKYRRELNNKLLHLYERLPPIGRLQYNSKNMRAYKDEINSVIEFILSHESVKYKFAEYQILLQKHQKELQNMYGKTKDNKESKYYISQMNKLYSKIGNEILHSFKVYQSKDKMLKELEFLKKNIDKMNFKSRSDYAKESTKVDIAKDLYKICKLINLNDNQVSKVISKWLINSKYKLNANELLKSFENSNYSMTITEYYKALKRLGFNYERYSKLKNKNFYKELNYKMFFNNALKHLLYEVEREEKKLEDELRYELEMK